MATEETLDLTAVMKRAREGDREAESELLSTVYRTLRGIARRQLRKKGQHSIQTIDVVHMAYLRLFRPRGEQGVEAEHVVAKDLESGSGSGSRSTRPGELEGCVSKVGDSREKVLEDGGAQAEGVATPGSGWASRAHFLAVASKAMRSIIIDHFRRKSKLSRRWVVLDDVASPFQDSAQDIQALDLALERLAKIDPKMSKLVELKYFAGASEAELAEILDMSLRTVQRRWKAARAWLRNEICGAASIDSTKILHKNGGN